MPERNERFFWLYGKKIDALITGKIHEVNRVFLDSWQDCSVECHTCVNDPDVSDRLWLFRLKTCSQKLAQKFSKVLREHIQTLPDSVDVPNLKLKRLKRRTNLLTPLVRPRNTEVYSLDIGLHVVNDSWNGALMTFLYYEGRRYNPPNLQLHEYRKLLGIVENIWSEVACDCHKAVSSCCGFGCYFCFQTECSECQGTGWKQFSRWTQGGYRIDYSSGFPIAVF